MTRAVRYDRTGGPEVLHVDEVPIPEAADGGIVVRVRAAGLQPFDAKVRSGIVSMAAPHPRGIGTDFAGVVEQVGAGAVHVDGSPVRVGDEVLGSVDQASQRERLAVPAGTFARKPDGLAWEVAGVLTTPAMTALACVRTLDVTAEDTVLVSAAAGGVGSVFCQLAIARGATVVGTASPANHARLIDLGVVPVAYGPGMVDRVRETGATITKVQDCAGRETIDVGIALGVAPERICTIVDHDAITELGLAGLGRYTRDLRDLERLASAAADGGLDLAVAHVFALADVVAAYTLMETGHPAGKVVLDPTR